MITFEHVTKRYGERLALDDVSWHMDEGECIAFVGHSGAGKTTLLRLITHELAPTSGVVAVGTFNAPRLPRRKRALLRRTLGIVYEDFRLLNDRSVFENVALAVRIGGRFADTDVLPHTLHALQEVGLQDKRALHPSELSFGERQRVAIARAIVNQPAVVLADEPTGALEGASAREVIRLLQRTHREGAAVVLVTTRQEVAEALGGRVLHLDEGRLSTTAPARSGALPTYAPPEAGALPPTPVPGTPAGPPPSGD